jgi:hypothetical protein
LSIDVIYRCGGCEATAEVRGIRQTFRQCSALMAEIRTPTFRTAAPKGWVAFDPYTGCCYCPQCWAEIEAVQPRRDRSRR